MPDLVLTRDQRLAVDMAKACRPGEVRVIRGLAGTGKTTCLKTLVEELRDTTPVIIAPTGRAALRVHEAAGLPATTIHRWCYSPVEDEKTGLVKFVRRVPGRIPDSGIVLVDEASMVGRELWQGILDGCSDIRTATGRTMGIVVCGDGFQLPPVEPRSAEPFSLMDDDFQCAARADINQIVRQAEGNPIIAAGFDLRAGHVQDALDRLSGVSQDMAVEAANFVWQDGGAVICHRNATRHALNDVIRRMQGRTGAAPEPGEPLLVRHNNYEMYVFNGETAEFVEWVQRPSDELALVLPHRIIGADRDIRLHPGIAIVRTPRHTADIVLLREEFIPAAERPPRADATSSVRQTVLRDAVAEWCEQYAPGSIQTRRKRVFNRNTKEYCTVMRESPPPLLQAELGYVFTAHKMQGSQAPDVLVIAEPTCLPAEGDSTEAVMRRRWMYTAISRAQRACAVSCVGYEWP